jgi:hypothetical protein
LFIQRDLQNLFSVSTLEKIARARGAIMKLLSRFFSTKGSTMWTPSFWRATAERSVKTFAQTVVALVGTDAAGFMDVAISKSLVAALVAAGLSVLTSIASTGRGSTYGPSLAGENIDPNY